VASESSVPPFFPLSVLDAEGVDIGPLLQDAALDNGVPLEGLLALVKAESELAPRGERWGSWSRAYVQDLIARQDYGKLANVIFDAKPDISFGLSQVTVGLAGSYGVGDGTWSVYNVLDVREALFDRKTSIDVGARHYAGCLARAPQVAGYDPLFVGLVLYNSGSWKEPGSWYWTEYAGNIARYVSALEWARGLLKPGGLV
jgi:hypothetical protein